MLQTGDGRPLPLHLKAQVRRELDRLELLLAQIKAVEAERDALLAVEQTKAPVAPAMLLGVKGIGPEFAAVLWSGGLSRPFENRRQIAAYAGLAPTPWQSGVGRSRTRHLAIRQSATTNDDDPACLAMAAASAGLGARSLVPRPRKAQRRPPAQDDDRGAGAKAACSSLEICDWRRHRRCCDEDRMTIGPEPIP
jgi:transposase